MEGKNPVLNFFQTLSGRKFFTREPVNRHYTRAGRHQNIDTVQLKKRRKKAKAGRKANLARIRRARAKR